MRAVRILPTKMLGVVADHGDWPVERISIGCGMGQLSIEPEEDKSANIAKKKLKANKDETSGAEQQQKWWVGSVGHDDTLRMTDLEGFFREAEQAETDKGALAADLRDDDSDTDSEVDGKLEENSKEKKPEITESDSSEQHEGESSGESDVPLPKKRKRKSEKDALNTMKKQKGKNSIVVERSFFDDL